MSFPSERSLYAMNSSTNIAFNQSSLEYSENNLYPSTRDSNGIAECFSHSSFTDFSPLFIPEPYNSDTYSTNSSLDPAYLESFLRSEGFGPDFNPSMFTAFQTSPIQDLSSELYAQWDSGAYSQYEDFPEWALNPDLDLGPDESAPSPQQSKIEQISKSGPHDACQPCKKRKRQSKPLPPGSSVFNLDEKRKGNQVDMVTVKGLAKAPRKTNSEDSLPKRKRARNGKVCARCKLYKVQCDEKTPCRHCLSRINWREICCPAKLEQTCFSKGVYRSRLSLLVENVEQWLLGKDVSIGVGFVEFSAILPVSVTLFRARRKDLLDHISFRVNTDKPLTRRPSEPWGLRRPVVTHDSLDRFFDRIMPDMFLSHERERRDPLFENILQLAYNRSRQPEQRDSHLLQKVLRLWAAQSSFFGRPWTIRDDKHASAVKASYNDNFQAFDVPRMLYWQLDYVIENYISTLEAGILKDREFSIFPPPGGHRTLQKPITIFLAAYIYLTVLEKDTWTLKTWAKKSEAWKTNPLVSENPTMRWPRVEEPSDLIGRNDVQAALIANYARASNTARLFSAAVFQNSNEHDVRVLGEHLSGQMAAIGAQLLAGGSDSYQELDSASLDYTYSSKLLMNADGTV